VAIVVVALGVAGLIIARHVVDHDRRAAADRRADVHSRQVRAQLENARSFAVGLGEALQGETVASNRRFAALQGSASVTVGLTAAMWVERVSAAGRAGYERRIGRPITVPPGAQVAPRAARYLPATFVSGVPFRRGADMSALPALAATLRDPASVFAGTATPAQTLAGRRGFFVVQGARFGRGPGSRGYLVVFVPAGGLSLSLNERPERFALGLDGRRLAGSLTVAPTATRSFTALARRWRIDVARDPATEVQSTLPWLVALWPLVTALVVFLVSRGMLRRRRAEREVDDIFDLSLDLLCILGQDGYFKRVNPAFERTLGHDADRLLSRPMLDFVHPADREATATSIGQLGNGSESLAFEHRVVRADGKVRRLEWVTRLMPERGLMYAAARDITDTRALVDEQAALRRVATLIAEDPDAGELFDAVAAEVGQVLGADATRLLRFDDDGAVAVVASHGASDPEIGVDAGETWAHMVQGSASDPLEPVGGAAVAAPIVVSGRPWGGIVAAWKHADIPRADTEVRMAQFTELVATAVANAESRAQLAASRQRVVATADETRRRIERDLHDGAQQQQVQTIFAIKLAQQAIDDGAEDAPELLARALENAESANDQLREIARGIHPAVLTKGGLAPALKTIASRCPIPVQLDVRTDARLPERVEVTAYYVVAEALTNAAKHSRASSVRISVDVVDGALRLSIIDDGVGGADPGAGSGLVGLRDRIEAAGGTLSVRSARGAGTELGIEVPAVSLVAAPRRPYDTAMARPPSAS
jgi:PAS domain S-box-containing protein